MGTIAHTVQTHVTPHCLFSMDLLLEVKEASPFEATPKEEGVVVAAPQPVPDEPDQEEAGPEAGPDSSSYSDTTEDDGADAPPPAPPPGVRHRGCSLSRDPEWRAQRRSLEWRVRWADLRLRELRDQAARHERIAERQEQRKRERDAGAAEAVRRVRRLPAPSKFTPRPPFRTIHPRACTAGGAARSSRCRTRCRRRCATARRRASW